MDRRVYVMTSSRISVIIPIHNAARHLSGTLQCIAGQSYANLEIICVLDAPGDGSDKIAERFAKKDPRFLLIRNKSNLGPGPSRNIGAAAASGGWIHFMDADDIIGPNFYGQMIEQAGMDGGQRAIDVSACNVHYEKKPEHGVDFGRARIVRGRAKWTATDAFIHGWIWRWLIRREFWNDRNFLFPNLSVMEDMPVVIQMVHYADAIALCPGAVYYYKNHADSIVASKWCEKKQRDWRTGREMVRAFAKRHGIKKTSRIWYLIKKRIAKAWRAKNHAGEGAGFQETRILPKIR